VGARARTCARTLGKNHFFFIYCVSVHMETILKQLTVESQQSVPLNLVVKQKVYIFNTC
jgi:hypothetical protein